MESANQFGRVVGGSWRKVLPVDHKAVGLFHTNLELLQSLMIIDMPTSAL